MKNLSNSVVMVEVVSSYIDVVEDAEEGISESEESSDNTWMYIVIPIVIFCIIAIPCFFLYCVYCSKKRKQKAINEQRKKIKKDYLNALEKEKYEK